MAALGSIVSGSADAPQPPAALKPVLPLSPSPSPSSQPVINIPPDEDPLLRYLTASIQQHGHRQSAARVTARTLLHLHAFTRAPPLPILREAIFKAAPAVRCMNFRIGAKAVVKPVALGEKQRIRTAVTWILKSIEKPKGVQTLEERLARELIGIIQGTSSVLQKKEEVHKLAMANRQVSSLVLYARGPLTFVLGVMHVVDDGRTLYDLCLQCFVHDVVPPQGPHQRGHNLLCVERQVFVDGGRIWCSIRTFTSGITISSD